ncbi:MAG: hypothetical protein AB7O21_06675, partial [Gammaproteobacteria bacterium]
MSRASVNAGLLAVMAAAGAAEPPPLLSRAELAACLADEESLHTQNAALDARKQALTAQLTEIQALEAT